MTKSLIVSILFLFFINIKSAEIPRLGKKHKIVMDNADATNRDKKHKTETYDLIQAIINKAELLKLIDLYTILTFCEHKLSYLKALANFRDKLYKGDLSYKKDEKEYKYHLDMVNQMDISHYSNKGLRFRFRDIDLEIGNNIEKLNLFIEQLNHLIKIKMIKNNNISL